MDVWSACMSVYNMYAWCPWKPATGVTHGCKPPHGCWDLNLNPLEMHLYFPPLSHLSSPSDSFGFGHLENKKNALLNNS